MKNNIYLNNQFSPAANKKIYVLQGLRGILLLEIFMFHSFQTRLFNGAFAVSAFFMLSGFVLVYKHLNDDTAAQNPYHFARKKILSIYPYHVLFLLLAFIPCITRMIAANEFSGIFSQFSQLAVSLLLVQSWIPDTSYYFSMNGISWYLSTSIFLYFCFPFICSHLKQWHTRRHAYVVMVFLILVDLFISLAAFCFEYYNISFLASHWFTYIFPPARLPDFLIGCCLGYLYLNHRDDYTNIPDKALHVLEAFTIVGIMASILFYNIASIDPVRYVSLFAIPSLLLIFLALSPKSIFSKFLLSDILIQLGDMSPYLYISHGVSIEYLNYINKYILSCRLSVIDLRLLSFLCIIIFARSVFLLKKRKAVRGLRAGS